jgi:hypothetical protein
LFWDLRRSSQTRYGSKTPEARTTWRSPKPAFRVPPVRHARICAPAYRHSNCFGARLVPECLELLALMLIIVIIIIMLVHLRHSPRCAAVARPPTARPSRRLGAQRLLNLTLSHVLYLHKPFNDWHSAVPARATRPLPEPARRFLSPHALPESALVNSAPGSIRSQHLQVLISGPAPMPSIAASRAYACTYVERGTMPALFAVVTCCASHS